MPETNIPYELVGPDGTRAVFNDPTDVDHVGWLDGDNCTGLEAPNTREAADTVAEGDGGVHGTFYRDRRFPVLQGMLNPNVDMTGLNILEAKLKRASRALAADAVLTWQPTGQSARRMLLRRASGNSLQITGRRPKLFQLSMVAARSSTYSASENSQLIDASAISGEIGLTFPLGFPLTFNYATAAQILVVNQGDDYTPWRARIDGPMTNPRLFNNTTGQDLRVNITLGGGDTLWLDSDAHTVLLGGTADRYSTLDFASSSWWLLAPGSNDIRLLPTASSSPAAVTFYWRNAYE